MPHAIHSDFSAKFRLRDPGCTRQSLRGGIGNARKHPEPVDCAGAGFPVELAGRRFVYPEESHIFLVEIKIASRQEAAPVIRIKELVHLFIE